MKREEKAKGEDNTTFKRVCKRAGTMPLGKKLSIEKKGEAGKNRGDLARLRCQVRKKTR